MAGELRLLEVLKAGADCSFALVSCYSRNERIVKASCGFHRLALLLAARNHCLNKHCGHRGKLLLDDRPIQLDVEHLNLRPSS